MEENERLWDGGIFWGFGPFGIAPNGMGYTYPNLAPFYGIGTSPNLWSDSNFDANYQNPVMRNNMNYMPNNLKPIEMLYPKCYKMMMECVYKECNMFLSKNNAIMPNKICKEEFCKMVKHCAMQLMNNEDMFMDKLKEPWACARDISVDEDETEIETRGNLGKYGNMLVESMVGILMIQELRKKGCLYCY